MLQKTLKCPIGVGCKGNRKTGFGLIQQAVDLKCSAAKGFGKQPLQCNTRAAFRGIYKPSYF